MTKVKKTAGKRCKGTCVKPLIRDRYKNNTERLYAQQLEMRKKAGEILDYRYEELRLVMANNTSYTPDFLVVFEDHFEIHEVKGFWRPQARVKIKACARQFPWFRFIAIQYKKKQWRIEEFSP